uniref:Uncharacterized protein n=1 Tax=Anguilla anguilla TaxID=7936 RepID=A0A0E9RSU1_ANGAN
MGHYDLCLHGQVPKRSRTIRVDSLMCGLRKENAALPFSLLTRALSEHAVLGDKIPLAMVFNNPF